MFSSGRLFHYKYCIVTKQQSKFKMNANANGKKKTDFLIKIKETLVTYRYHKFN